MLKLISTKWTVLSILCLTAVLTISITSCKEETPPKITDPMNFDPEYRGEVVSYELMESWSLDQVDSLVSSLGLAFPLNNGIDIYKVIYKTIDAKGTTQTTASGALCVPTGLASPAPIGSYNHGTVLLKSDAPSQLSYEITIGIIFAGTGVITAMPDYLGLGEGPGRHPYVHAKSQATATVDMLRASKDVLDEVNADYSDQLFLFGYSQGGHACMAAVKELEAWHTEEFTITASAPMSGPYDIVGAQTDMLLLDVPYSNPWYLPYVLLSYNDVYDVYDSPADFLKEPWASTLYDLLDGTHSIDEVNEGLLDIPKNMIVDEVFNAFVSDDSDPFRMALQQNTLLDWTPIAPMKLYFCTGDEQVTFQNAINAKAAFADKGVDIQIVNGELLSGGTSLDHTGCVEPVLISAKGWFETLMEE